MWRERVLKIVLVLVGLLFTAGVYPLIGGLFDGRQSEFPSALTHQNCY